jgi:hypothetical protein
MNKSLEQQAKFQLRLPSTDKIHYCQQQQDCSSTNLWDDGEALAQFIEPNPSYVNAIHQNTARASTVVNQSE